MFGVGAAISGIIATLSNFLCFIIRNRIQILEIKDNGIQILTLAIKVVNKTSDRDVLETKIYI